MNKKTIDPWKIINKTFNPPKEKLYESIFAQANGYMGIRGSMEEVGSSNIYCPAAYVAGVFDKLSGGVPDLVNIPNWLLIRFRTSDQWFEMKKGKVLFFRRLFDIKRGLLIREVRWQDEKGKTTSIQITRFLSHTFPHLGAIRYSVIPENYSGTIEFELGLDGNVDNGGIKYLEELEKGCQEDNIYLTTRTKTSKIIIGEASKTKISSNKKEIKIKPEVIQNKGKIVQRFAFEVEKGKKYNVDKIVSIYTSQEVAAPAQSAMNALRKTRGFEELLASHSQSWRKSWEKADIIVNGDPSAQIAIRFCLFHLLQSASQEDRKVSIAAKGLSNVSGGGYKGHVFWDTEIYILPFFIFTAPEIARNLLIYRYHTLNFARKKAKRNGYRGAMYPWESAGTGEEATPKYGYSESSVIRIWTGEKEQHISADVAYAIWQYYQATGDRKFLKDYGAEIILETARFWASRMTYHKKERRYEIKGVIGPDEYHEKYFNKKRAGVDNNFFTNAMSKWNIKKALEMLEILTKKEKEGIKKKINLQPNELSDWQKKVQNIYLPFDKKTKIFSQFDNFMDLKYINIKKYAGASIIHRRLAEQGINFSQTQIIKQADVIMALYLLPEVADLKTKKINYDFYERRTLYGSSLGGAIYAIMAQWTGQKDRAYKHFLKTVRLDIGGEERSTIDGIHAAAMGGAWQIVVNGFAGFQLKDDKLSFSPNLPKKWKSLKFNLKYQARDMEIKLNKRHMTVKIMSPVNLSRRAIAVEINGVVHNLKTGEYKFTIK